MIVFNKFIRGAIRSPEDDGAGGGGGGDASAAVLESHDAEATALFGDEGAPAATGAGDDAGEAKDDAAPPAAEKPAAAKPAGEKKAAPFSPFGKKPDDAATKAADATKAATEDPEDKIQLGEKAGADTKNHFASLKTITKQLRAEKAAIAAELETARKAGAASPEMEKLRAEHKALSDRLAIVDIQNHPDYVRQFVEPKNKILAGVSSVLADNKVEGVDVASLLGKPRPEFARAVSEIAAKLPAFEQSAFLADMRQLHTLDAEAKSQLSKSGELAAALQRKSEETHRAAFAETWKTLDFTPDNLPALEIPAEATAEERAAMEAYNAGIANMRTSAEQIAFGKMDEKGVAATATKAAAFDFIRTHAIPRMEAEHNKAVDLIQTLTAELQALKASRRGGGGSGIDTGAGADADESHEVAASKTFKR